MSGVGPQLIELVDSVGGWVAVERLRARVASGGPYGGRVAFLQAVTGGVTLLTG